MALHKENELDDFKDHFDLYRLPDFIFQELISHRLNVVIQNVEKVNSDASRSEDMINYLKLKYRKSITLLKNIPKPVKKLEKEDKTTGKILINSVSSFYALTGTSTCTCKYAHSLS